MEAYVSVKASNVFGWMNLMAMRDIPFEWTLPGEANVYSKLSPLDPRAIKNRVYAFWPFYGRFDGSPDSGAIASTVEITSSTQGTAGAPTVDFFDGR